MLDRFVACSDWQTRFPSARVTNLHQFASSHNLISLFTEGLDSTQRRRHVRRFCFESMRPKEDDCIEFFRVSWQTNQHASFAQKLWVTSRALRTWSHGLFSELPSKIRPIEKRIAQLQEGHVDKSIINELMLCKGELTEL